jgi:hypothetical protein
MSSEIEDTIMVIGNVGRNPVIYMPVEPPRINNDAAVDVHCFCMSDHKWYKLPPVPYSIGGGAAFCTYGSKKLYVSGGRHRNLCTAMYNGDTNAWRMGATMNDGKFDHVMITVGDSLYVLGGGTL